MASYMSMGGYANPSSDSLFGTGFSLNPAAIAMPVPNVSATDFVGMANFGNIAADTTAKYMAANADAGLGGGSLAGPSWYDKMVGYKNTDGSSVNGWGGMALGTLQGLGSAYMGMRQYGLAKDQLQFSKDSFNKNYEAQKKMTNASMQDRQRARVASNPGAYQSVSDYMTQNGIA